MTEALNLPQQNGSVEPASHSRDVRPVLLRAMVDLYVQKQTHTEEEEQHFTKLALRLIDLVDAQTRAVVAGKIAGYPTAPAAVRQRLLKELISLKAPDPAYAEAHPLAGNAPAPASELSELFFASNAEERRLILLNLPYAPPPPAEPVAPAIARESTHRLEAAALGHNSELFARELERIFVISRAQARRLYEDELGEPIVVAALALGMPTTMLQRILLCLNPKISQSVQRVYDLALLHQEIEPGAALRLIAIWQASHPAERSPAPQTAAHQPQYRHDEKSERRAAPLPVTRPKLPWDEFIQAHRAAGG
ncbi:MAG: hypothetical protein ACXWJ8_03970 [Xanthobacteraceae bacterium]